MEYDQDFANAFLKEMFKQYKIRTVIWHHKECGRASLSSRTIRIPYPIDSFNFGICLHEIKHIIDGDFGYKFQQEFECEVFALDILKGFGFSHWKYAKSANYYVLSHLAKQLRKGFNIDDLPIDVRLFYPEIDFSSWKGKTIRVYYNETSEYGYEIRLTSKLSKKIVTEKLDEMGLNLSQIAEGNYFLITSQVDPNYKKFARDLKSIIAKYQL